MILPFSAVIFIYTVDNFSFYSAYGKSEITYFKLLLFNLTQIWKQCMYFYTLKTKHTYLWCQKNDKLSFV